MIQTTRDTFMFQPRRVLRWIYIGRLCLAVSIFIAALFVWEHAEANYTRVATLVLLAAIGFTGASLWKSSRSRGQLTRTFAYLQAVFDLCMVTAIVHITGGALSQFAALYILVTASASLLLPVGGGLLIAILGNVLYYSDVILQRETTLSPAVILQLLVFGVVALGTAFLSARLKQAGAGREELEAQLELARMQAEDILRNIASGVMTIDAQDRLLYANPAAGNLLGFDADRMLGKPIGAFLAETAPVLGLALQRAVSQGTIVRRGEARIHSDGRDYPIGLTTTTVRSDPTRPGSSATVIFTNITDIKAVELLRLRAERLEAVAELSASLAHEIKNPLASIRSAIEQLSSAPRATDDERILGALIVRESDRLSRLLSEFLDFARARVTRVEKLDLGAIVQDASRMVSAHPDRKKDVEVTCSSPEHALIIDGDNDLLHRAVFNLALNAVQACPSGGQVRIEVGPVQSDELPIGMTPDGLDGLAVALRIGNSGAAIPDEVRDRMFDPFFTTKTGGTGLGLPIAHRAIEAHRGVLVMDSSDRGTSFTVFLPATQPQPEPST
ncbi:MAG: ATP-binding protein [Gemmatimonadota bacterium]|nr:ATP-binding protein [Gemmatimonadota bacterium]